MSAIESPPVTLAFAPGLSKRVAVAALKGRACSTQKTGYYEARVSVMYLAHVIFTVRRFGCP